ncbi:hypothetical protein SGRA_3986 [Saprospira grandis str. Lewin]|uniref:Uncharacterized protein n=1 Tax=Saprospira grandis (strain Lewin) TaxID=984262 RepID=H6L8H6_SAPGL|nr:hypothetical protein SGRA_3986 [Saprospira grandis str. Lewin]
MWNNLLVQLERRRSRRWGAQRPAEGWIAVAVGQTQFLSLAKKRRAERAASCGTARPARRAGQPQKKRIKWD